MPEQTTDKRVPLEVNYAAEGTPSDICYFHNTYGMVRLDVDDGVATLSSKWDRLGDGSLKDGFERGLTTGDVLRSVQALPFVDQIEVSQ